MAFRLQVVFDCSDPASLSKFYAEALNYRMQDPPTGYESWQTFLKAQGIVEAEWSSSSAIVDPDGKGRYYDVSTGSYWTYVTSSPPGQTAVIEMRRRIASAVSFQALLSLLRYRDAIFQVLDVPTMSRAQESTSTVRATLPNRASPL